MYAKLLKIVALGLGAVVTTGIPSGNVSVGPNACPEIEVHEPYKLTQKNRPWEEGNQVLFKWNGGSDTPTKSYDSEEKRYDLAELQKAEACKAASAPANDLDPNKKYSEIAKPMTIPGTRIIVLLQSPVFERDAPIGHMSQQAAYGSDVCYSGTLFQPPTSRVEQLRSYTHQWWQKNGQDDAEVSMEELFATTCMGVRVSSSLDSDSDDSPSDPPTPITLEPVPEPAGWLAVAAGLPGLALLRRRKTLSAK